MRTQLTRDDNAIVTCTAWLWGNQGHIVTNNQCFSSQEMVDAAKFGFDVQTTGCDDSCTFATCPIGESLIEKGNVKFIKFDPTLDYAVLQITTDAKHFLSTYGYLKIRLVAPVLGEKIYIPQHSHGKAKMIATTDDDLGSKVATIHYTDYTVVRNGTTYSHLIAYTADAVPGSSGSPVLSREDNTVVGLHRMSKLSLVNTPPQRHPTHARLQLMNKFLTDAEYQHGADTPTTAPTSKAPFHFLDVGCGPGVLTFEFAYRYLNASPPTDIRITATDLSDGMLHQLSERLKDDPSLQGFASKVAVVQMDGLTLDKVESGSVDVVGSNFGLALFPGRSRGWTSAHRVLKDEGVLMVTAWDPKSTQLRWFDEIAELFNAAGGAEDEPMALPSSIVGADKEKMIKELQEAGFRNVEVYHTSHTIVFDDPNGMIDAIMNNPLTAKFLERLTREQMKSTLAALLERDAGANFFQAEEQPGSTSADLFADGRPRLISFAAYTILARK
ncbi:hypothetical protein BBJ28_00024512 [Nothophytophthora sp. Chile5]|nr:hypothetical protein BBJ28_00024512 [Nothophytophthora sp. Chile5]